MSGRQEMNKIVRQLKKLGWTVEVCGSGHYKAKDPDKQHLRVLPSSPSDGRSIKNVVADLKRCGVNVRP